MNVQKSVHCGGEFTGGANFFTFIIKLDQSEMTKSHMFIPMSLTLINQK